MKSLTSIVLIAVLTAIVFGWLMGIMILVGCYFVRGALFAFTNGLFSLSDLINMMIFWPVPEFIKWALSSDD